MGDQRASNTEAERAVLGAIILEPEAFYEIQPLAATDFTGTRHQRIYEAIFGLVSQGQPIDIVAIGQWLHQHDVLDEAGGLGYLTDMTAGVLTATNAAYHAKIIRELSSRRRLYRVASQLMEECLSKADPPMSIGEQAIRDIEIATNNAHISDQLRPANAIVSETVRAIEAASERGDELLGIPTGLPGLNKLTNGYRRGAFSVLAARPSVGKSALATLSLLRAAQKGIPCLLFSLEMGGQEVFKRLLAIHSRISFGNLQEAKNLDIEDFHRLAAAERELGELPLWIDDTPAYQIHHLMGHARRWAHQHEGGFLVIDYLQLIMGSVRSEQRYLQVAEMTRMLKQLARTTDVAVLALAQLNRRVEQRGKLTAEPKLSDLRESGSIEQDADLVVFVHRPRSDIPGATFQIGEDNYPMDGSMAKISVAKQRNGPTGYIPATFNGPLMEFREITLDSFNGASNAGEPQWWQE